ncbi:hypothetical protein HPP92_009569 [Vanilla planifolia]|uniref:Uncharacterized protein n=1 Tax=Vanilla planifolia TaxID=51239 RepID=A0A835RAI7_VANPL|nr:hypothetical protein HPP92_009569 [Vanilla planifolia]
MHSLINWSGDRVGISKHGATGPISLLDLAIIGLRRRRSSGVSTGWSDHDGTKSLALVFVLASGIVIDRVNLLLALSFLA